MEQEINLTGMVIILFGFVVLLIAMETIGGWWGDKQKP